MKTQIPAPIIALIAKHMSQVKTHADLDSMFMYADAPGDAPDGSKPVKCQDWLRRTNAESLTPLAVLGKLIEEEMETPDDYHSQLMGTPPGSLSRTTFQRKIKEVLERYYLVYRIGGKVQSAVGMKGATKSLSDLIKGREFISIDLEFERAIDNANSEPREACSAACNILESLFKIMIEEEKIEKPTKQDLKSLWKPVADYLNFDPKSIEDNDLRKILSGMNAVVDGVGALRTHASSAHGAGKQIYKLEPRHARLAIHSAHTLATFVLESWDKRRDPGF